MVIIYRKFFTEFGLNVLTSYKVFMPLEQVYEYEDGHNYNIYAIAYAPRIYIDSIDLSEKNQYHIKFCYESDGVEEKYEVILDHLLAEVLPQKSRVEVVNNRESFNLYIEENHFREIFKNEDISYALLALNDGYYCLVIEAGALFHEVYTKEKIYFEVLYIGQAYGKNGNRSAQQRLKSHDKLQKILTDFYVERRSERLFVFLFEIEIQNHLSMDGINSKHLLNRQEETTNFHKLMEHEHQNSQIINIFEASLIHYFKPPYNVNLINNFPNKKSKGYTDYFSLDYNSITSEIDLHFDMRASIALRTETASIDAENRFITYQLHNDPERLNMYDIFISQP